MADFQNSSVNWVDGKLASLDVILKKLDVSPSNAKPEVIDQVIVQYDRRNAVAEKLEDKRWSIASLLGLRKPVEYYRVDNYQAATVSFDTQYKVQHPVYGT